MTEGYLWLLVALGMVIAIYFLIMWLDGDISADKWENR